METQKESITLTKSSKSFKLTVTRNLEKQIRFLCEKLPRNEWSGTLFYTVEGSFKDNNIHVICKDFFLQDVGAATYTEFKNDTELAAYMADHELWDCYTGLCHSHNSMATFFSGTDVATLREEGNDNNHFVSLIVNNAGTYSAAITRKVRSVVKGENLIEYNTFNNIEVKGEATPFEKSSSYIEYYPLDVTVEALPVIPKSELELRLEAVRKNAQSYINKNTGYFNPTKPYNIPNKTTNNPTTPTPYHNPIQYLQTSLYDDKNFNSPAKKFQKEEETLDTDIAYDVDHFNPLAVKETVMQIITGDIFSIFKSNTNFDKWVDKMEELYDRRFKTKEDFDSFNYWVDSFVDFLENEIHDDNLYPKGRDYMSAIWAYDVISKLKELKSNNYLQEFIKSLKRYLI